MRRLALDTQLYVGAIRDGQSLAALRGFLEKAGMAVWGLSIVAEELLSGSTSSAMFEMINRLAIAPFEQHGRVLTPDHEAWKAAGLATSRLRQARRMTTLSDASTNDLLIAATCAREEVTLITKNTSDFERIATVLPFSFADPWPGLA